MFIDLLKKQKDVVTTEKKSLSHLQDQLKKLTFTKVVTVCLDDCSCGRQCGFVTEAEIEVPEDSEIKDGMFLTGYHGQEYREGEKVGGYLIKKIGKSKDSPRYVAKAKRFKL